MTEIQRYLERATRERSEDIDWSCPPWAAAQAALAWLGIAPEPGRTEATDTVVSGSDAEAICDAMISRLVDESGQLAWSSYMLRTAVVAVAAAVGGPPEALLASAWKFLADRELNKTVYEFCRALGNEARTQHGAGASWDLRWMKSSASPSQACLRYWILAVKPELWEGAVEKETMEVLRRYPLRL